MGSVQTTASWCWQNWQSAVVMTRCISCSTTIISTIFVVHVHATMLVHVNIVATMLVHVNIVVDIGVVGF